MAGSVSVFCALIRQQKTCNPNSVERHSRYAFNQKLFVEGEWIEGNECSTALKDRYKRLFQKIVDSAPEEENGSCDQCEGDNY